MYQAFWLAVQFLTRLPTPSIGVATSRQVGISVLFYPVVGLLIGCLLAVFSLLIHGLNQYLQAALVLVAWVFLTGGLHLDGLADCADAWAGGLGSKEQSLAIMKDPAAGPIAVIILILIILVKWSALISIVNQQELEKLLAFPIMGRVSILLLMLSTPYVREKGLGETMSNNLPAQKAWGVVLVSLLISTWILGFFAIALACLLIWVLRRMALLRLGGVTGDVYGAVLEMVEAASMVIAVWKFG